MFSGIVWRGSSLLLLLGTFATASAEVTVGVNPSATWIGYMNVFELPANGGAYVFGSSWGVADLNASFSGATLMLTPNTSISRDVPLSDPFWWTSGGSGNKTTDASVYVQDDSLAGQTVTFKAFVLGNSLETPYAATAFIKNFAPDYSSFTTITTALTPGEFSISLATASGNHVQYGFETIGPNARLDEVAGLGFAQITEIPEPATAALLFWGVTCLIGWHRSHRPFLAKA